MKFLFSLIIFIFFLFGFIKAGESPNLNYSINYLVSPDTIAVDTIKSQKSDTTSFKGKLDNFNGKMETIVKYSPLPIITYSSLTDWLFGVTKINSFRIGDKDNSDTTIQPSTITGLAYFTLNQQFKFVVTSKLMFGHNKYQSQTEVMYINFPEYYFGVGNDTKSSDSCLVSTQNFAIIQGFSMKFSENWYVGIKYEFNNYIEVDTMSYDNSVEGSCNIDVSNLPDNEGIQSGFGIMIARETRDNRFNARKGSHFSFEYLNFSKSLGSKFSYNSFIIEYSKYVTPIKWLTIAGQVYTEAKFGDVPIQSLARMGGSDQMRGLYDGRFRDHTMITTQVELRFPLYWIFGGTLFTGLGEVAPTYGDYTWDGIKLTYGLGLRLMVYEPTRTNLRFDVGFFENKPLFFFTFSEAF